MLNLNNFSEPNDVCDCMPALLACTSVLWNRKFRIMKSLCPAASVHLPLDRRANRISQIMVGTNEEKHGSFSFPEA